MDDKNKISKRYSRNMEALSAEECEKLHNKSVCIVGCGGLGCYVLEALARIGVLKLRVVDCDVFDETNLNRQLYSNSESLGRLKVEVAKEVAAKVNPEVKLDAVQAELTKDSAKKLIEGADLVVDCLDNFSARFWLANACEKQGVPIIFGAIAGWYGQVSTIFPGDITFVDIYGSMKDGQEVKETEGNLPFTAACVASIQAAEAVKTLLGHEDLLRNKILMIDMRTSSFEVMELNN